MPIETIWANNTQSILIEKFRDDWTWQQVAQECELVIHSWLEGISHPVVLIQDMVGSHWRPTTNLLQEVKTAMQTPYPDNLVLLLVVSGNPAIDTLVVSAYQRTNNSRCVIQACATINQAMRIANDYLG